MFITIEGIDGTGKSTLAKSLAAALGADRVLVTREPTDQSPWGLRLRAAEREGRLSPEDELLYFHRDRLHHLESLIKPALAAGKIVICDRYFDSTLAYQARTPADVAAIQARFAPELLTPDLVLILECPVPLALQRIGAERGGRTQFEVQETLERAQGIYRGLEGMRYRRIDAAQPPENVLGQALEIVRSALQGRSG